MQGCSWHILSVKENAEKKQHVQYGDGSACVWTASLEETLPVLISGWGLRIILSSLCCLRFLTFFGSEHIFLLSENFRKTFSFPYNYSKAQICLATKDAAVNLTADLKTHRETSTEVLADPTDRCVGQSRLTWESPWRRVLGPRFVHIAHSRTRPKSQGPRISATASPLAFPRYWAPAGASASWTSLLWVARRGPSLRREHLGWDRRDN